MCWECDKRKIKLTVDSTDKTVYKILNWDRLKKCLTAWYIFEFKYNLNTTYKSQLEFVQHSVENGTIEVYKGLHSYLSIPLKYKNALAVDGCAYITSSTSTPLVAECIIPAGTLYGVGMNNEVISTILHVKRIIPWEELVLFPGTEENAKYAATYKKFYNLIYSK